MNNNMYLYFDSNGYLKEFITCPARAGSENVNSIYFYVEPALESDRNKTDSNGDAYYALPNNLDHGVLTFKLHDVLDGITDENGVALNSLAFTSANFRIEDIQPFDKERDLLFFKWFRKYQFVKVDLTSDILLTPGNVECTIGCYNSANTKVYNLDLFSFYVADSAVQSANYVTTSQYHMLLALMKSGLSGAVSRYDIDVLDTLADIYNLIGTQISVLNIDDKEYLVEMSNSGSIVLYDLYNREWYAYEGSDTTAIGDVTRYLYRYHIATMEDLENFGNLFTYKGIASVAQINALTNIGNGWCYNLTDSGTLTLGNLQVEQGDNVAFDGTVWTKLSSETVLGNYYTKQEGQEFESGIDNRVSSVENELSSVASGSPKGVYATLAALQAAYPTGTEGIYVISASGHWFYWNGSAWTDGGVYQASEGVVPETRKIAGINLEDNISKTELQHALDVDRLQLNQREAEDAEKLTLADKNSNFVVGAIYYGVGVVQTTETSYRTTDYVDISGRSKLDVTMITNATFNNWGLCFFDANKQYIGGIAPNTTGTDGYETRTVNVPTNAVYIRASFRLADLDNFYIKTSYLLLEKANDISKLDTATALRQSKNYFDIENATLDTTNNLLISPFVPVSLNDEFYLSAGENPFLLINYQFHSVRLYNANKQFIEMVYWVSPYKIVSSNVKYVKFAVAQTQLPYIYVTKGGYNHHIYEPYFEEYYEGKDDTARQEIADKNSFLWASVNMFDRVGGIGDSYTAGYALNSQNQGYTSAGKSWLGVLCKRAGVTMANYGYGGATTRSYITQELPTVLADTACDFYFLALGINDMTLGTSYIGSVADIDDSNPDNNADTFYGNYGKIIAKVKQKNPKALFVLIKLQNQGTNVMSAFNTAIEGLAEHYGIPVINPFDDLFFKSDLYTRMRDGHPTFLGYCGMGMAYERLFAKCVLENRLYFFDATIG